MIAGIGGGIMGTSYILPFEAIKRRAVIKADKGALRLEMPYDDFLAILRQMLHGLNVDEEWYRSTYADIGDAIANGDVGSAKAHFVEHGYFEGRLPGEIAVDEKWYLETYPDVAAGIRAGDLQSAEQHFREFGYFEGRLPHP